MYIGASSCIYFFGSWCILCFDWVIHDRGKYIEVICFLFLVSYCLLFYIYELFMIYVFILCYVKLRSYFVLLVFSTHAFMRLLSVSGNIQVNLVVLLSTLAIDR